MQPDFLHKNNMTLSANSGSGRAFWHWLAIGLCCTTLAAQTVPHLPAIPYDYLGALQGLRAASAHQSAGTALPAEVTNEGATLGRVLFYDRRLSANDSIACASCHRQERAFSDPRRFSVGFQGDSTRRNAMSAVNMALDPGEFFWDLRAPTLEAQALMPIQDSLEMGMNLDTLAARLSRIAYYPPLFQAAFGSPVITAERIGSALAQFMRSIISNRSKFDRGIPIEFSNFTVEESAGLRLFTTFAVPGSGHTGTNCFLCHELQNIPAAFGGEASGSSAIGPHASIGLDEFPIDPGVGAVTGLPEDSGTFKIPTIRNVEITGPYMHDGRFSTLEEVIDHYDHGIQPHVNLHPILRDGGNIRPGRLDLTAAEKAALLAFLKTLTDYELINDPRFSDPFQPPLGISSPAAQPDLSGFELAQNFPNPFNPLTIINYQLPVANWVTLTVYDVLGRKVKTLVDEWKAPGDYRVQWEGRDNTGRPVAAGVYFYRLTDGAMAAVRKMLLVR